MSQAPPAPPAGEAQGMEEEEEEEEEEHATTATLLPFLPDFGALVDRPMLDLASRPGRGTSTLVHPVPKKLVFHSFHGEGCRLCFP